MSTIYIYRKSRISEWYKNTNEKVGTRFFSEKKHVIWNLWHLFVWVANLEFHSNLVQTGAIWTSASGKLNWSLMRAVQSCPGNGRFLATLFSNNHNKLHCKLKIEFRNLFPSCKIWNEYWIWFHMNLDRICTADYVLYSLKVKASFDVFMKSGAWSHTWYLSILGDRRII